MESISPKIFTVKAISFATFLGGPLSAGFLISKNFKEFGNHAAARNSIFIGIISTLLIFAGIFLTPENIIDKIPQPLIPAIYTAIIAFLVEKLQGRQINEFLSNGGKKASNWLTAGYSLIGLLVMGLLVVIVIFVIPPTGYDKSISVIDKVTLHYPKEMDVTKPEKIAQIIKQTRFMEGSQGADLYFSDERNCYILKFVIADISVLSDTSLMYNFNQYERFLNANLKFDKPIKIGFTDTNLGRNITLPKINTTASETNEPLRDLLAYKVNSLHTIYYSTNMPIEDVKKVGVAITKLKAYFPIDQPIDIIFLNNGNEYTIKLFVAKQFWQNPSTENKVISILDYIKGCGINKDIKLVLVDSQTAEEKQIQAM